MPIKKDIFKYLTYFTVIFIIPFILIGVFLEQTNYFKIKKVLVNKKEINKNKIKLLTKEKNIYSLNINNVINRVKKLYKVYYVEVIKKYPDTLIINIIEKDIVAILNIDPKQNKNVLYGLNKKGKIIRYFEEIKQKNKYPIMKTNIWNMTKNNNQNKYSIGTQINNKTILNTLFALYISKKINENFFYKIKTINLFDNTEKNFFIMQNIKTKFFFGKQLMLIQLVKLISLMKYDLNTIKNFAEIDLKFNSIIARKIARKKKK